jgi:arylsulfatase A-like enzyme
MVVFTADHGFSLGDHGGWGKRTLWDTDTRVPLIVRTPATRRRALRLASDMPAPGLGGGLVLGRRDLAFIELVDLFPTLAALGNLDADLSATREEPSLDGASFATLLDPEQWDSASRKSFATSQFPRCPVRINRQGERKSLLSEPWRTAGAGGFECQGTSGDWTANHDLTVMGYTLRSKEWRYVAWVRVLGYKGAKHQKKPKQTGKDKSAERKPWSHNNLVVNWTYPPYVAELYDHRHDRTDEGQEAGGVGVAATAMLHRAGGGFDLGESLSVLRSHGEIASNLFAQLQGHFERNRGK